MRVISAQRSAFKLSVNVFDEDQVLRVLRVLRRLRRVLGAEYT
jgi:hypothetical protein